MISSCSAFAAAQCGAEGDASVAYTMTVILVTMVAFLAGLVTLQKRYDDKTEEARVPSSFLPSIELEPSKRAYEMFCLCYTPIWIMLFGIIIAFELYEDFTAIAYDIVCIGLALPLFVQPIMAPSIFNSPDGRRHWTERYSSKANVWLAFYSFIGNYWYTHYFYSVLKAKYTMPSHRLNNVPIALYFATHFYFSTYHVFSNMILRKITTTYQASLARSLLFAGAVICFSYFTAFMETLTISSFPYYTFEDRDMAYTVGSAFYGIYFLVSFPAFFRFDERIDYHSRQGRSKERGVSLFDTVVSSCGHGMIILCLLDVVRLYLGVPLVVGSN